MPPKLPARKNRRRGQALLESALTLLIVTFSLIAIVDFGQILFIHVAFTERIRDALRRGSVGAYNEETFRNYVRFGQATDPGTAAFMGLTSAQVLVQQQDAGTIDQRVTITISGYDLRLFTPFIAGTIRNDTAFSATLATEYPL